jgi:hypothetical protein
MFDYGSAWYIVNIEVRSGGASICIALRCFATRRKESNNDYVDHS